MPTVASPIRDTPANLAGWQSVQLDPNEEGSSAVVAGMEEYALTWLSSADISHDEDFSPLYSAESQDFSIHSNDPGSYIMTVNKVSKVHR